MRVLERARVCDVRSLKRIRLVDARRPAAAPWLPRCATLVRSRGGARRAVTDRVVVPFVRQLLKDHDAFGDAAARGAPAREEDTKRVREQKVTRHTHVSKC